MKNCGHRKNTGDVKPFICTALLIAAFMLSTPIPAWSDEYEVPQPVEPAKIHGRRAFGANYQLQNPVFGDGFMRFYKLSTFYGSIRVIGDELLKVRFRELAALQFLDELKLDAEFNKNFDVAIVNSLSFNQESTKQRRRNLHSKTSGVKAMFDSFAQNAGSSKSKTDKNNGSSTDISRAKRQIAFHLGVDPYTDFKPLNKQLNLLSRAGEKGVTLIASMLASLNNTAVQVPRGKATTLQIFIRDKTPSELKIYNRKSLIDMDIDESTVNTFLSNVHYTASDQTALSFALNRLTQVSERHIFLRQAAIARHREVAYFHRKRAELFADYHEYKSPLKKFVSLSEFAFAQTQNDRLLGLFVIDELVWTPAVARAMKALNNLIRTQNLAHNVDLHITGAATKLAKSNLKQLKWNVFTKAKFK